MDNQLGMSIRKMIFNENIMQVVYKYSKTQLNEAVAFLSENNSHFRGMNSEIESSIIDAMNEISKKFPETSWLSTMGFTVYSELASEEDLDFNNNSLFFTILVDPSVGSEDRFVDEDYIENIITI